MQPSIFLSHGSPMIVLDESPAHSFLKEFGGAWEKPRAVLVASAHYDAPGPSLASGAAPETIHDFGGFSPALYAMRYPAPGAPDLAARAADLLAHAGFSPRLDPARGYDHGVWTPLKLIAPKADVPVLALSIDTAQTPAWHYRIGQALLPLRREGVLIIGSGAATHNLRAFFTRRRPEGRADNGWVEEFRAWLAAAIAEERTDDILDYRRRAPFAGDNHPSEDHILPLFVALGAGGPGAGRRVHASIDDDVLAMDAFSFGEAA